MANMAIEAGGKNGIIEPDGLPSALSNNVPKDPIESSEAIQAHPMRRCGIRCFENSSSSRPSPYPSNVKDVREIGKIEIDQVVIGSCTNAILMTSVWRQNIEGEKSRFLLRLIIIPATRTFSVRP